MTNVSGVSSFNAKLASANDATSSRIDTPRYFAFNRAATELREMAEQHPGTPICHFIAVDRLVFITCTPRNGLEWSLRVAHYNAQRPHPQSLAEEKWHQEIEFWRKYFLVPDGATQQYDPQWTGLDDDAGYAVIITWREITAQAPQLALI